jgi:Mg/Co/Ni transporter MgtE
VQSKLCDSLFALNTEIPVGGAYVACDAGAILFPLRVHYIESLLYQVKPGDPRMLAFSAFTVLAAALLAALPPVIRAVRIDPALTFALNRDVGIARL